MTINVVVSCAVVAVVVGTAVGAGVVNVAVKQNSSACNKHPWEGNIIYGNRDISFQLMQKHIECINTQT